MPDDKWQIHAELLSRQVLTTFCSIISTTCLSGRGGKTNADYPYMSDNTASQYKQPQFAWTKVSRWFKTLHINAGFSMERTSLTITK